MSDAGEGQELPPLLDFAEFLMRPPGQVARLENFPYAAGETYDPRTQKLPVPEVRLHCVNWDCEGERTFRSERQDIGPFEHRQVVTLEYKCGNCGWETKTYVLLAEPAGGYSERPKHVAFKKLGEDPAFGVPLPPRVLSIIGPDKELFLKGKRCENQGLGVGAFAYYRRVVDAHWHRILAEIIRVAEATESPPEMIATLRTAQKETQFSRAVEAIKDAIPETIKVKGRNPLTLLYSAISDHLHDQDDAACLELAADVRRVLVALAERTTLALNEQKELGESVKRLAEAKLKPKPSKTGGAG
jgi:hypothetical protein